MVLRHRDSVDIHPPFICVLLSREWGGASVTCIVTSHDVNTMLQSVMLECTQSQCSFST